jgi:acyl-CoA dehydrogenase family protein 9
MCYLTTGLIDAGVQDTSIESAVCKIAGTEFLWYQANRALQLAGGKGYMRGEKYEKILRDIRIFPIFEGANDVLRSYVALTGMKPVGEKLQGFAGIGLSDPIHSIGVLADYVGGRLRGTGRLAQAHPQLKPLADSTHDQVGRLRDVCEKLLREHRKAIIHQGLQHRRISDAVSDIYAQIAVISRVTALFAAQGVEASGQEQLIAKSFCESASRRVNSLFDQVEHNQDATMRSIARLAYKRGSYGYELAKD